jgi:hypothetical protein
MKIKLWLLTLGYLVCLAHTSAAPAEQGDVDRVSEGYEIVLWQLYHQFERFQGGTWGEFANIQVAERMKEIDSFGSDEFFTHVLRFNEENHAMRRPLRDFRLSVVENRKTQRVMACDLSIIFVFPRPATMTSLLARFSDASLIGRMVRLASYRGHVSESLGVQSIEVTFQRLANHNAPWNCNGFSIESRLQMDGTKSKKVTYCVGSGMDPFKDLTGRSRDAAFESKDVLVDPGWGPGTEREESGEKVFYEL